MVRVSEDSFICVRELVLVGRTLFIRPLVPLLNRLECPTNLEHNAELNLTRQPVKIRFTETPNRATQRAAGLSRRSFSEDGRPAGGFRAEGPSC